MNAATGTGPVNQLHGQRADQPQRGISASASPYTVTPQRRDDGELRGERHAGRDHRIDAGDASAPANDYTDGRRGPAGRAAGVRAERLNILPPSGGDRLRFVNASRDPIRSTRRSTATQLASNIAFATASGYVQTRPATVTITFTDAVTGAVVASQDNIVLTANQTSSVYLIGPPGAQGILVTQDN